MIVTDKIMQHAIWVLTAGLIIETPVLIFVLKSKVQAHCPGHTPHLSGLLNSRNFTQCHWGVVKHSFIHSIPIQIIFYRMVWMFVLV